MPIWAKYVEYKVEDGFSETVILGKIESKFGKKKREDVEDDLKRRKEKTHGSNSV